MVHAALFKFVEMCSDVPVLRVPVSLQSQWTMEATAAVERLLEVRVVYYACRVGIFVFLTSRIDSPRRWALLLLFHSKPNQHLRLRIAEPEPYFMSRGTLSWLEIASATTRNLLSTQQSNLERRKREINMFRVQHLLQNTFELEGLMHHSK